MSLSSLVPRPSHCPVFDRLQYAKTEGGKAWSILSCEWRCVARRQEGPRIQKISLRVYLIVSVPSSGVSKVHKVKNVLLLVLNEEHTRRMCSFKWGYSQTCLLLCKWWCHIQSVQWNYATFHVNKQYVEHLDTLRLQQIPDIIPFQQTSAECKLTKDLMQLMSYLTQLNFKWIVDRKPDTMSSFWVAKLTIVYGA